jgi:hypothetical protein
MKKYYINTCYFSLVPNNYSQVKLLQHSWRPQGAPL